MTTVIWRGWNGQHGNWNRRWAWLIDLGDGWYQVKWRDGSGDPDPWVRVNDSVVAVDKLCEVLNSDVLGEWREIPT